MKKVCLTLGAALLSMSSFAAQRILYQQNFETATDIEATGWSYGGGSISIASDEFGKFLQLSLGQNNGRSGQVTWGQEIYMDADGQPVLEDGTYTVKFDFCIGQNSNNQYNSEITLFTNHTPRTNETYRLPWSSGYTGPWNNFVFDLSQCNTAADADMLATVNAPLVETETTADDGTVSVSYSINTDTQYTFNTGMWYTVTVDVNTTARTAEYTVVSATGDEVTSGVLNVPETDKDGEPISMYAEGLFVMTARYQTIIDIDGILISYESSKAVANEPTVALTRLGRNADDQLDLNLRAYTITFLSEETLHVTGTDGQTVEVEYADCDGSYIYETTTSGVLKAWTTSGDATSEVIEINVDCSPCVLPAAEATISSVATGFGKTYTLTVNNSDVPLRPTIFISYEFKGTNGETLSSTDEASGVKVELPAEGTLTVTTQAFGYQATTTTINNNLEFEVKKMYDFARMSKEDLTAAGFKTWNVLNSGSTSGFNNWTARKRLYYYDINQPTGEVDDNGNPTYVAVYPFGFIAEDNTTNVLEYSEIATEDNAAGSAHFEGLDVYAGHNLSAIYRVGVYNNETSGGNNKNIDVFDLDNTDFVLINRINNYGGNSNHPVVATDAEYYELLTGENEVYSVAESGTLNSETGKYTVSIPVYRIDTAASCLTIFAQKGAASVGTIGVDKVENSDPWFYTIDGLRLAEPTRPGLYIHKGKKIIVK